MQLLFSTVSPSEELRAHSVYCFELEELFDLLDSFVAADYRLISASLVDKGQYIELPLEAFDGRPMRASILLLKEQYQHLLSL